MRMVALALVGWFIHLLQSSGNESFSDYIKGNGKDILISFIIVLAVAWACVYDGDMTNIGALCVGFSSDSFFRALIAKNASK